MYCSCIVSFENTLEIKIYRIKRYLYIYFGNEMSDNDERTNYKSVKSLHSGNFKYTNSDISCQFRIIY